MPTLFAAEDLQSRLCNLLDRHALIPLGERDPDGRYAVETVYLLARYPAWEQLLLRFTYLATEPMITDMTGRIRRDLACDRFGTGPWTLFRPPQMALGQAVAIWHDGGALADTISFLPGSLEQYARRRTWPSGRGRGAPSCVERRGTAARRRLSGLLDCRRVSSRFSMNSRSTCLRAVSERFTVGLGTDRRISARSAE